MAVVLAGALVAGCESTGPRAASEYRADQPEARNMRLVGYNDLQARSAYQPVIHQQGSRWIAYIGHHGGSRLNPLTGAQELNGTSILDVTDPKSPKYLYHIPGAKPAGAQMVRICDGKVLPKGDRGKVYMLRSLGNVAHEVWDVTAPEKPVIVTTVVKGLNGTHKNWWECDTGIAYLVSGVKGWRSNRMTQVFDLSDPAKPVHIRDFGLPGQQPGTVGEASPYQLHGPISTGPGGNRIYFGYGTVRNGVVQIIDREKLLKGPREPTDANLLYPQVAIQYLPSYMGAHTTLPVLGMEMPPLAKYGKGPRTRDILVVVNESTSNECNEPRQMAYIMDITDEKTPFGIANFDVPESPGGFCARGGRFGAHSSNENMPPMYAKRVVFVTWFNAGLRAIDIRDPYNPKEIGYYIPAITEKTDQRCLKTPTGAACKVAIQSNNVEVDDRGYIYVVDRADTGVHILELTGAAREVAKFQ